MNEHSAKTLADSLHVLFSKVSLSSVIKWCVSLLIIAILGLFLYETFFSSSFYYGKLEHKLELIEKAKRIGGEDSLIQITVNQKLYETLHELEPLRKAQFNFEITSTIFKESMPNYFIKILGLLILPFIMILAAFNDPDLKGIIKSLLIISTIFLPFSIFTPSIYSPWINLILTPFVQIIILWPFVLYQERQNKKKVNP